MKTVSWFSCGAASAVATKLAFQSGADPVVVYQDTGAEHPDNVRFLADCENWFDREILVMKSPDFDNTWDVWEKRRYIAGVYGAPCTAELKRKPAEKYIFEEMGIGTREVYGYTVEEQARVEQWITNNDERNIWPILVERQLNKADCLGIVDRAGIEIPVMYKMGYKNNNCIGCPKGGAGYWNKIRVDSPETFDRMAKLEREVGAAICKTEPTKDGERQRIPVYLDELPPDAGNYPKEPSIACGLFCIGAVT